METSTRQAASSVMFSTWWLYENGKEHHCGKELFLRQLGDESMSEMDQLVVEQQGHADPQEIFAEYVWRGVISGIWSADTLVELSGQRQAARCFPAAAALWCGSGKITRYHEEAVSGKVVDAADGDHRKPISSRIVSRTALSRPGARMATWTVVYCRTAGKAPGAL
ncbi:MAG: hypothetical protein ACLUD2_03205 [Clostridium sp.]